MTTSSIPPIGPHHGIGRVNSHNSGKKKDKSFAEAFGQESSDEETPAPDLPTRILQPKLQIIRKETEDGEHHIDVIA